MLKTVIEVLFRMCVLGVLLIAIGQVSAIVQADPSRMQNESWTDSDLDPIELWEQNPQHPHPEWPVQKAEIEARRRGIAR